MFGQFDLVTCYSDSICYMEDEVDVGQVFTQVYQHLNEGGRFIFDVHSIYQIDEVFPGYSYHENAETFAMSGILMRTNHLIPSCMS